MHCERAQEFLSGYVERSLDRPHLAAVEAHLLGCADCRDAVLDLQAIYQSFSRVPAVEPPVDGEWQVIRKLREVRAEDVVNNRHQPALLDWLRSLSPLRAAVSTGLLAMVVLGSYVAGGLGPHIRLDILGVSPKSADVPVDYPKPALYVGSNRESNRIDVQIRSTTRIPKSEIAIHWGNTGLIAASESDIAPSSPARLSVPWQSTDLMNTEAVQIEMTAPSLPQPLRYQVVLPARTPRKDGVTVSFFYQSPVEAVRMLAPWLDRPVVLDAELEARVTLQSQGQTVEAALAEIARTIPAKVEVVDGSYRIYR